MTDQPQSPTNADPPVTEPETKTTEPKGDRTEPVNPPQQR